MEINSAFAVAAGGDAADEQIEQSAEAPLVRAFVTDSQKPQHSDRVYLRLQPVVGRDVRCHRGAVVRAKQVTLPVGEIRASVVAEHEVHKSHEYAAVDLPSLLARG